MDEAEGRRQLVAERVVGRLTDEFAKYRAGTHQEFWRGVRKSLSEGIVFANQLSCFVAAVPSAEVAREIVDWYVDTDAGRLRMADLARWCLELLPHASFADVASYFVLNLFGDLREQAEYHEYFPPTVSETTYVVCREIAERTGREPFDDDACYLGSASITELAENCDTFEQMATMASLGGHVTRDTASIIVALHVANLNTARGYELLGDLASAHHALSPYHWDNVLELVQGILAELKLERELFAIRNQPGNSGEHVSYWYARPDTEL